MQVFAPKEVRDLVARKTDVCRFLLDENFVGNRVYIENHAFCVLRWLELRDRCYL